jgi:hypothetical protein
MGSLPNSPAEAAQFVWIASLVLGVVVSGVVAILLWLIHREAATINSRVSTIWDVGQRVANNTIHIPTLYRTNAAVREILANAVKIKEGAEAIERHARACPGCPQCLFHR